MAGELICDCRKRLASGFEVVARLGAPLEDAAITVLFGPSGAGKSTLLRLIAGLDRPDAGAIWFRDATWCDVGRGIFLAPQQRRAGLLFQESALFPHLTVAENVAFASNRERATALMERLGVASLAGRMPRSLSGGEQQRVALARALAAGPELLLLDEPLSALDAATRARMRQELRRILHSAGVPSILVTHDRTEAMALGDWMAVMVQGTIRQAGPVQEVFRRPADPEVAESVGVENVISAEVVARESGIATLQVGGVRLECVDNGETGAVLACVRAEEVTITREVVRSSSARNRIVGSVESVTMEGPLARVELDCGFPLLALVTAQSAGEMELKPGDRVCAVVKATAVHLMPMGQDGDGEEGTG